MTRIFFDGRDVEIAIRHQGTERVYPLVSLAAALRIEPAFLRARIGALLSVADELSTGDGRFHSSHDSERLRHDGRGTYGGVGPTNQPNQQEEKSQDQSGHGPNQANQPSHGAEMVGRSSARAPTPEDLAAVFGEDANVTALASSIRDVAAPIVREALAQTLAVPATRLRSHRAALFISIVRRLTRRDANPSPYARTKTSST